MKDAEANKGNSRFIPRACGLFMAHHRHVRKRKRQTKQLREETMKRIIVVCGVMGVVFVLVGVGFYIGEQAGTAHKIDLKRESRARLVRLEFRLEQGVRFGVG